MDYEYKDQHFSIEIAETLIPERGSHNIISTHIYAINSGSNKGLLKNGFLNGLFFIVSPRQHTSKQDLNLLFTLGDVLHQTHLHLGPLEQL